MTTFELMNRYDVTDCRLESVSYDESQITLVIEGSEKNRPLSLEFSGVSDLKLTTYIDYAGLTITKILEDYGRVSISLYDDISNDYYEITFKAECVTVTEK